MNNQDCMNGVQHSIAEVDERLRELSPHINREYHREIISNEVDELLDKRNLLVDMLGELSLDHYEEMMTNGT